jgi:predicted nucleotidyltransferase
MLPNMGAKTHASGLGDALFTKTQQKVLGLLFSKPDRSFYANEIVRHANIGTGAVHRELDKLSSKGLLTVTHIGNQKHYQADAESPIFEELRAIVRKTFGLAGHLSEALSPLANRISAAFVFGSTAAGSDTARSDIDLLIVGHELSYPEAMSVLVEAEQALGRKVNPTLYSTSELQSKLEAGNSFLRRVLDQPKIFLIGSPGDL